MFQPAALKVVGELLLHIVRQGSARGFQVGEERGEILFDKPAELCCFRLIPPIVARGSGDRKPAGGSGWQRHVEVPFDRVSLAV